MSPQPHCARKSALLTLLLFFTLLLRLTAAAPDSSPLNTTLDISALYQSADATCVGYEGQWNCLADKFQRCTAGKWTAALSCSADEGTLDTRDTTTTTTCSPLGRTDLNQSIPETSLNMAANTNTATLDAENAYQSPTVPQTNDAAYTNTTATTGTGVGSALGSGNHVAGNPATHAGTHATVGGGDAPTTRSGGIGGQIKGALAQGHGVGEVLRGKFNSAVDTAAGDTAGQAKNKNIATGGEREFAGKDFVKKGTLDKAL
ncbi:hypothetical protein K4K60_003990 [Colletotrichum sp. SAR11_57]|nr:hypothetical protein K4K60_003990 [Colletotrichum sp. SAR11_57]